MRKFKKIYIEVTNVCNLSCDFCTPHSREPRFMSPEEFSLVLDRISGFGQYIYLHVKGEPLLHPHIFALVKTAHDSGFFVNLTTNGTLLFEHTELFPKVRQINISLHSTHDMALVEKLHDFPKTRFSLRLWDGDRSGDILTSLEKVFKITITEKRQKLNDHIFISTDDPFEWPVPTEEWGETPCEYGFCLGLKEQIAILADGTVVPCCLDHDGVTNLGNIFTQLLDEILENPKAAAIYDGFRRRKVTAPLCKGCSFRQRFN